MGLVFHRRLAIPLWAIALLTVALAAAPPATQFLMPPTTRFVIGLLGIVAIIFTMPGMVPWLRTAHAVVRAVPSRHQHKTSRAITVAAGTCVVCLTSRMKAQRMTRWTSFAQTMTEAGR